MSQKLEAWGAMTTSDASKHTFNILSPKQISKQPLVLKVVFSFSFQFVKRLSFKRVLFAFFQKAFSLFLAVLLINGSKAGGLGCNDHQRREQTHVQSLSPKTNLKAASGPSTAVAMTLVRAFVRRCSRACVHMP